MCMVKDVMLLQAYSSWMKGIFDFEFELWKKAIENFTQAM
jgi:hypothetical protein